MLATLLVSLLRLTTPATVDQCDGPEGGTPYCLVLLQDGQEAEVPASCLLSTRDGDSTLVDDACLERSALESACASVDDGPVPAACTEYWTPAKL